jgi:hypothetical protein
MLVTCPWGAHPNYPIAKINPFELQQQYIKAIRLTNAFTIEIDIATLEVMIFVRRLEPDTKVVLHEVGFSMPVMADGSNSQYIVVGRMIFLNDRNCTVSREGNSAWILRANLRKVCNAAEQILQMRYSYYAPPGRSPHPDHIRVTASIDIDGDRELIIPDQNKVVVADRSIVGKTTLKIE